MDNCRRVRGSAFKAGPHDPPHLSMLFHSFADEFSPRGQNEVAAHSLPDEMKFVVIEPHIGARSLYGVSLALGIIDEAAGPCRCPDVLMALKQSDRPGI